MVVGGSKEAELVLRGKRARVRPSGAEGHPKTRLTCEASER